MSCWGIIGGNSVFYGTGSGYGASPLPGGRQYVGYKKTPGSILAHGGRPGMVKWLRNDTVTFWKVRGVVGCWVSITDIHDMSEASESAS